MHSHLTHIKATDRSIELTRSADLARLARPDRRAAPEDAPRGSVRNPLRTVRLLLTRQPRPRTTVA